MQEKTTLRVGTRGSALAVAQTKLVLGWLQKAHPHLEFEIRTIKTSGDEGLDIVGAFVKEVELELRNKSIDLAVHSLKDMPTELPSGVVVACIPARGEHRDCLISRNNLQLGELPENARVGTSSLRRVYQIKQLRPDLEVVPIRGNIITRMNKIEGGIVDAVVLAAAGLERVEMSGRISQLFSMDEMVSAVSQGALALEVREDDEEAIRLVKAITDPTTEKCVLAERAFLTALGGGCRMPIGGYAEVTGGELVLHGLLCDEMGKHIVRGTRKGSMEQAVQIGEGLAHELMGKLAKN